MSIRVDEEAAKLLEQVRAAGFALRDQRGTLMLHVSQDVAEAFARMVGVKPERAALPDGRICVSATLHLGSLTVDILADGGTVEDAAREARQMLGLEGR